MDPDPAEARRRACRLINNIAREHTLNGTIFGTQLEVLVNNCLDILSNQLYEKSTHFLLELIQNADDNVYACAVPTLSFSYGPGCLRIDCNEVGFDASNVTAICGISQSTKSDKSSDGQFIGEKGIGFKSVFKVADAVWIASNEFTFKFDRTKPLGVITPLWEKFPERTKAYGTSTFLQLAESYDEQTLVKELREFDSNVLIFLRRVEEINIEVDCIDTSLWKKQIRKTQYKRDSDNIVLLQNGAESVRYLTRTHAVRDLPREARRREWTETNILLAFPLPPEDEKPMLEPQNVYAFLPIRNYGFTFLIQADFILTASREDIESTLPWNLRIRDALSEAFLSAMLHFNEGVLRYTWPCYLASFSAARTGFFEPVVGATLSQLKERSVFESCAGNMARPSTLAYVPVEFCANGEPLTLCDLTKHRYLSLRYPSWVLEAMTSVGVTKLTPRQFLEDIATLIATDSESFHNKPQEWHTQLATTLVRLSTDAELMRLVQELAIIPLNDGTWTATRDNHIFFSKSDASSPIPDGIRILIVDSDSESDTNRRTLFTSLGVKAWTAPEICRLILSVHGSTDFEPKQLTTTQIVSHAVFLYKARWQLPKNADLWFATSKNERSRGREMYISPSAGADSASARVFKKLESRFPVVHSNYLTQDPEWLDWLVQNLGLSRIPRLVTPTVEPSQQPMESASEDVNPSHDQQDPPSDNTPARKGEPPHNSKGDAMVQDMHKDSPSIDHARAMLEEDLEDAEHQYETALQSDADSTEPFPSFDHRTASHTDSMEPFPVFDNKLVREPSTVPFLSPRDLLYNNGLTDPEGMPRGTYGAISPACGQCSMGPEPSRCDRKPVCSNCVKHKIPCYYPKTQNTQEPEAMKIRSESSKELEIVKEVRQRRTGYVVEDLNTEFPERQRYVNLGLERDKPPRNYFDGTFVEVPDTTTDPVDDSAANKTLEPPELVVVELVEPNELLFDLSEEFKFMLHECASSDIFQLIRENWHHYSKWIEGAHMRWQSAEYVHASMHLKNQIGATLAQTIRGPLPLRETVLAKLDIQLDQNKLVPALQLHEPEHAEWNFLTYFGVVMKSDVHYYLRCLITLSGDEAADVDVVEYIYEQIQSRYTGNEEIVRAAFYSKDIILMNQEGQCSDTEAYWTNMENCVSRGIDLASAYTNCSYLFRCLVSPSGDPIGGLVHAITMISSSSRLEDIARSFRELSKSLKDINSSKISLLLKPLQGKAIFPIVNGSGDSGYDTLSSTHDQTWFIADHANYIASFSGVIPLLAFSVQDLLAMEALFQALRMDAKKISKKVTSQTQVAGRTRSDFRYTDIFQSKSPFIKALIPRNHPAEATIRRQITQLRVRIATGVLQTFTMSLSNEKIHGKSIPGYVTIMSTDSSITLVMTEETAAAEYPPHELVSLLARTCGIQEQHHVTLLLIALGKSSLRSINAAFLQQGIRVDGLSLNNSEGDENPIDSIGGISELRMPSLFPDEIEHDMGSGLGLSEGLKFKAHEDQEDNQLHDPDLRIPMVPRIKGVGNTYSTIPLSELERKEDEFIDNDHMQFLGETMVARLLSVHLGSSFDPVQDWTSDLRERAGYTYVPEDSSVAPFTLTQAETIRRMTDFVVQYGVSWYVGWKERLRSSSPTYHVDVVVSGDSSGRFVMEAKWLERTMRLRLPANEADEIHHVNVLIHVAQAYSDAKFRFDVVVDPWHLLYSGKLHFSRNWLMQGSLDEPHMIKEKDTVSKEDTDASMCQEANIIANTDKQLVLFKSIGQTAGPSCIKTTDISDSPETRTLYLPWSQTEATGILISDGSNFYTAGRKELYTYKPLLRGYMRLLYLLPGTGGNRLQAVIHHIACNYAGTYQALSYVWGADIRDKELVTPNGVLPITTSLYKALLALRQKDQAVMLWVDAVCINQADNKEKAQQIRLMPEIFQACECMYAFLSEGNPDIDQVLKMLMQVQAGSNREKQQRLKGQGMIAKEPSEEMSAWERNHLPPLSSPIWSSVKALFELPYFRRAWIIQEVVAAPNVKLVCGKWLLDWKDLYAALEIVDRRVQIAEYDEGVSDIRSSWEPFTKLAIQREWEARQHRWSLLMLLEHFRYAESTLSRDRLFALVGLASDGNEAEFEPDYDSSFQDIVLRFAQAFVRQGRGIQLLYRAGISCPGNDDKFPSWIPDWTSNRPLGLHDSSDSDRTFSACGPQPPNLKLGPGPNDLSVDGYDVDTILATSTASNTESEWASYFAEVDAMIDNGVLSDTMGPKEDLRWKVPVAAAPFLHVESYSAFRKYINTSSHTITDDRGSNAHKSYVTCLQGPLVGWRFVVTQRGFVGVVPSLTRVGDKVAIMKGGCVPFVLRKSGEGWKLVGECFIHGFMKGESLWLVGVQERTFCLS